ncbi:MAG: hypothetical protein ACXWUI_04745, partial [Burkholderiales bacterium]
MDLTPPQSEVAAPLHLIALAAACAAEAEVPAGPEAAWIDAQRAKVELSGSNFVQQVAHWRTARVADARLIDLAEAWQLSPVEAIAVALACAAETDAMVGRVLAWLQAPVGRARPTLGLIATIAARLGETSAFATLAGGPARASGLLQFDGDGRVLPETGLSVPLPIVFALVDPATAPAPSGVRIGLNEAPPLPPSVRSAAHVRAHALSSGGGLVVRSGHPREARAVAAEIAGALGACAAFIEGDAPPGLGPWLTLSGCLPVLCAELAPGEKRPVPLLRGWNGPWLVASGLDGNFERECEALPAWRIPVPPAAERIALWHTSLGDSELARTLGSRHRHAAVRIAELARAGRYQARLDGSDTITANAVCAA